MTRIHAVLLTGSVALVLAAGAGASAQSPEATHGPDRSGDTTAAPCLLFQRVTGAGGGLFLLARADATPRQVAADLPGVHKHPDWSPDGTQVVFVEDAEGSLWITGVEDGAVPSRLPTGSGYIDYPAWSPDGGRIAFTRYVLPSSDGAPSASSIEIIDLAAGEITVVVRMERPNLVDVPRWSPDGTRLLVGIDEMDDEGYETGAALGIVDIASGELERITEFPDFAYAGDWGWANDTIIYTTEITDAKRMVSPGDLTWDVHAISPDGTGDRSVTQVPAGTRLRHPAWTPDGTRILAADEAALIAVAVDPSSGTVTPIGGELVAHPHLQPGTPSC